MEWILASGSPRRRELLERLGVHFRVQTAHTEEISSYTEPTAVVQDLALQKAQAVALTHPQSPILAADTIVVLDGDILGKPQDASENMQFLQRLQGRTHQVYTGIAIITPDVQHTAYSCTQVTMRALSSQEMHWYIQTQEGQDKAGGYGIQGHGMLLVSEIHGDFFNVMGLPVSLLYTSCQKLGLKLI